MLDKNLNTLNRAGWMAVKVGRKHVDQETRGDKKSEIGLGDMRSSQIFEEKRMPLEKADDGIDQVGEEDGERESITTALAIYSTVRTAAKMRIVVRILVVRGSSSWMDARLMRSRSLFRTRFQGDFHRGESALQRRASFIDGNFSDDAAFESG